jgi:hypothetical protein
VDTFNVKVLYKKRLAAALGKTEIMKALIKLGAKKEIKDRTLRTAYDIGLFLLKQKFNEIHREEEDDIIIKEVEKEEKEEIKEEETKEEEDNEYKESMVIPKKVQNEMKRSDSSNEIINILKEEYEKKKIIYEKEKENYKEDNSPINYKKKIFEKKDFFDSYVIEMLLDSKINENSIPIIYRSEVNMYFLI